MDDWTTYRLTGTALEKTAEQDPPEVPVRGAANADGKDGG